MTGDQPRAGLHFHRAARDVLMADAVKSVAADSLFEPLVWAGINISGRFKRGMESRVENSNLRDAEDTGGGVDRLKLIAIVGGGDLGFLRNRRADLGSDQRGSREFSPVNDAVADNINGARNRFEDL